MQHVPYSGLIWGVKFLRFSQILLYPQNFNHENFQTVEFMWWNGAYPRKYIYEKFLLFNPQKFPPSKLTCYMVAIAINT